MLPAKLLVKFPAKLVVELRAKQPDRLPDKLSVLFVTFEVVVDIREPLEAYYHYLIQELHRRVSGRLPSERETTSIVSYTSVVRRAK